MKRSLRFLFGAALFAFVSQIAVLGLSVRDVEQMAFDDAYRLWRQELDSARKQVSAKGIWFCPGGGITDPRTGRFTPSIFTALTCRLGQLAHLHEAFLTKELITDEIVHLILESSTILCRRCGIDSQAQATFVPGRGYFDHAIGIWIPQHRQKSWLEALKRTVSFNQTVQRTGASRSAQETNATSSAAGSRR